MFAEHIGIGKYKTLEHLFVFSSNYKNNVFLQLTANNGWISTTVSSAEQSQGFTKCSAVWASRRVWKIQVKTKFSGRLKWFQSVSKHFSRVVLAETTTMQYTSVHIYGFWFSTITIVEKYSSCSSMFKKKKKSSNYAQKIT